MWQYTFFLTALASVNLGVGNTRTGLAFLAGSLVLAAALTAKGFVSPAVEDASDE
jgi:hypothetical protein